MKDKELYDILYDKITNSKFYFKATNKLKFLTCITSDNVVLNNAHEIAVYFKVNPETFANSISSKMTEDDVKNILYHLIYSKYVGYTHSKYRYTLEDGTVLLGMKQISEHFGLSMNRLYFYTTKLNKTLDEAIKLLSNKVKSCCYTNKDGISFGDLRDVANYYNLSYAKLSYLVNRDGLSIEKALLICPKSRKKETAICKLSNGEVIVGLSSICNYFHISRNVAKKLLEKKINIESFLKDEGDTL